MSSLFKLSIQGIRSFDSERSETIQFGFPLTLICGQNGCGKTTIIECLKYATTGDLPPNSKGGAFVIDTEIVGRNNVTAQVKLAFKDVMARSMITTRSMQLTRKRVSGKPSTNTFKTLEGQLAIIEKGNKQTLSTKNAELDARIPIHLGASRAILDYVIFCHQDDSLWPLSEASVLKKRFDDIFDASKFTKVLDNLKNIKKEMSTDIKLIEQSVNHLQVDKDRSKKIRNRLDEITHLSETLSEDITEVRMKIEKKDKEAEELFQTNQEYQQTLAEVDKFKQSKRIILQHLERLESSTEILHDPIEMLMDQKLNFGNFISEKEVQIERLKCESEEHESNLVILNNKLNDANKVKGSLTAKEKEFSSNVASFQRKFLKHADDINFSGSRDFDSLEKNNISLYDAYVKELTAFTQEKRNSFNNAYESNRKAESDVEKEGRTLHTSITQKKQNIEHFSEEIVSLKSKISEFQDKLKALNLSESEFDIKNSELQKNISKFNELRDKQEPEKIEGKIKEDQVKLAQLDKEIEIINKKINTNNKQSDIRARLTYLRETKSEKSAALEKLIEHNSSAFREITNKSLSPNNAEELIEKALTNSEMELRKRRNGVNHSREEAEVTKALVKTNSEMLKKLSSTKKSAEAKILKVISKDDITSFETVLRESEEDFNTTYENLNTVDISREFKIKAIKIAESNKHCQLCQRPFNGPELQSFLKVLKSSLEDNTKSKFEKEHEDAKRDMMELKAISRDVETFTKSNEEITILTKEIENNERTMDLKVKKVTEYESMLKDLENNKEKIVGIKKTTSEIGRVDKEINELSRQIEDATQELSRYGASSLSINELQTEQHKLGIESKSLREVIDDNIDAKFVAQQDLTRLENRIKDSQLAVSNIEKSLYDQKSLKASLEEALSSLRKLESKEHKAKEEVSSLTEQEEKSLLKLAALKKKNKEIETADLEVVNSNEILSSDCSKIFERIKIFIEHDVNSIMQNTQELECLSLSISDTNSSIKKVVQQIKALEKEVNQSSNLERNIISNIDMRNLKLDVDNIDNRLAELDVDSARKNREEYLTKSNVLREELVGLNSEYSSKSGEIKQLKDQIKSIQSELRSDYKAIDEKYHEEWIKLQTNLLISNDIQTYSKALDNAIMKYHTMKMEDINRSLKELWSQTYKGTDIDTIAIKSDVNVQAKGNRSYNYRVVMYKASAELDMRGRCSAGQKVLSSILIRLALAECFGVNCGMIALDEPTTNLDDDNAESLANALNQIVNIRKSQRNFQLIVITHDEKFLSHINGDQFADHFYRVQRDENQRSTIYSLPISRIRED